MARWHARERLAVRLTIAFRESGVDTPLMIRAAEFRKKLSA
jgi:hypothetical protein